MEINQGRDTRFPIVALTADVQESAKQICLTAGMDGYLTKPLNQKVLAEALRKYCIEDATPAPEKVTLSSLAAPATNNNNDNQALPAVTESLAVTDSG